MTTFKPFHVWRIAAACLLLCAQAAHAENPPDPTFQFQFNATNTETGQAVQGAISLYIHPIGNAPLLDETLSNGTRHRSFALENILYPLSSYPTYWNLTSGSLSISNVFDGYTMPTLMVDQYLHTDGSSSLTFLASDSRTPARHDTFTSELSFKMDCACNNLFTNQIDANTFARYDTLNGKGNNATYFSDVDRNEQTFESHISFAATAVPEPGAIALMLAGLGVVGWRRTRS